MRNAKQPRLFPTTFISLAISAAVLVACGGGASEDPATDPLASSRVDLAVSVVDGPIQNAQVCLDRNDDGGCDEGEPQGRTDGSGQVVLAIDAVDRGKYPVLALIGTDAIDKDSGAVATAYRMVAPAEHPGLVSPLTTMVVAQAAVAGAGLTAANVGLAVALSRPEAADTSTPAAGARLDQFRFSDAGNWQFRVLLSSAAENTPAGDGSTRYREQRQSSQAGTLTSWAFNNDPNRRGDPHWNGSHWVGCTLGTQGLNSAPDAQGRRTSNYCDSYQIAVSRGAGLDIAGKTVREVFEMIRATPGQGVGFGDGMPGFSGSRDETWLAGTWPAGSSLRYQATTPLATAMAFDVRESNKVSVFSAEIAAGGDARSGAPACASVTSANAAGLQRRAATLEDVMAGNLGAPCQFNRGSLVNADGSRFDSGETNEWWSNSTISLGKVGSEPLGVQPYMAR